MAKALVRIDGVTCEKATAKAILCAHPDWEDEIWFPLSQIDDDSEVFKEGSEGTLVISEWIAGEKGLLGEKSSSSDKKEKEKSQQKEKGNSQRKEKSTQGPKEGSRERMHAVLQDHLRDFFIDAPKEILEQLLDDLEKAARGDP